MRQSVSLHISALTRAELPPSSFTKPQGSWGGGEGVRGVGGQQQQQPQSGSYYSHSECGQVDAEMQPTRSLMSTAARGGKNEERRAQSQGLQSVFHLKAGADVC